MSEPKYISEPKKCCICKGDIEIKRTKTGEIYWTDGNDPWPVNNEDDARCCDVCNDHIVIPARLVDFAFDQKEFLK